MNISSRAARCAAGLAAALLLPQSGLAAKDGPTASDTPQDYTHILPLTVSGRQGVVGFRLPQAVYLNARTAGLNDLRVFDANGAKLPFALHVPPRQQQTQHVSMPARIFPIVSNRRSAAGDAIDLDIKTTADGSLVSVKAKSATKSTTETPALAGLVLDLRPAGQPEPAEKPLIEALRFSLPPKIASYSAQVWLEVSDDLKRWDTIGAAELSWLVNSDTQTLTNDRLEFEPRSFRYARLTWRSSEPLQFAAINAESVTHSDGAPALEKLLLQPTPGKEAQDLVYRAGIAIPVEKVGLQFSEANVVLSAALGSYRELPGRQIGQPVTWKFDPLMRATFYQITQEGQQRRSGDIAVPSTHMAEWVLRAQTIGNSKPALRLSWQPATLVFLAGGTGPYTLAFGRDKAEPAALELSQVAPGFSVQELAKLEQAAAGALQTRQGAKPADESGALAAASSAQTRMWILWGVLLLGVGVLGVMGWRLFKQMK